MLESQEEPNKRNLFKSYEYDYQEYLNNRSSNKQEIIVIDKKEKLMQPSCIERKLKNEYIQNLINKKKIDYYDITLKPILSQIIKWKNEDKRHLF